jgi:hypothetical protein
MAAEEEQQERFPRPPEPVATADEIADAGYWFAFRLYPGLTYVLVSWQGWLAVILFVAITTATAVVMEPGPAGACLFIMIAVLAALSRWKGTDATTFLAPHRDGGP